MDTRIAVIGIIASEESDKEALNSLLSEYNSWIIGRMGLPYKERNVAVISIIIDAPQKVTSALSGKIGMIEGIQSKTLYAKEK